MDIAFFTDSYLPTHDGVAKETHALARAIQRLGHRVTVYTARPGDGGAPSTETLDDVDIVRVRSVPMPRYGQYRFALFPYAALWGRITGKVDVVHLFSQGMMGLAGFLASRRAGTPVLGTFNTDLYAMRSSFPRTAGSRLFFRAVRPWTLGLYWRCDMTTAPSEWARKCLTENARKPWRSTIEVVENGVEVDRFHPGLDSPDWRGRCGFGDVPLVTFLSRLTADKGPHRFLDAVARLPAELPFGAVLGGVGPQEGSVRERIRTEPELARRVRYLGGVAEEEKASLLAQSDVFAIPSTCDTASIVLLEAMACGAACIGSSTGGPAQIIRDGETGLIVDPHPDQLTLAIERLVRDPGERRALGVAATAWVRSEATIERSARRFISLYTLLQSERRNGAPSPA